MKINEAILDKFPQVHCNLDLGSAVIFLDTCCHRTGYNKTRIPRTTLISRFTDHIGKFNSGW
jgi:hypothetical protein